MSSVTKERLRELIISYANAEVDAALSAEGKPLRVKLNRAKELFALIDSALQSRPEEGEVSPEHAAKLRALLQRPEPPFDVLSTVIPEPDDGPQEQPAQPQAGEDDRQVIQAVYTRAGRAAVCGVPDESHSCDAMACSSVEHVLWRGPLIVDEPARDAMTDWRNGENMAVQNKRSSFDELVDVKTGDPLHPMKRTYGGVTREQFEAARAAALTAPQGMSEEEREHGIEALTALLRDPDDKGTRRLEWLVPIRNWLLASREKGKD